MNLNKKLFYYSYKFLFLLHVKLVTILRFFIYRMAVISKPRLFLLMNSEFAYYSAAKKKKNVSLLTSKKTSNKRKRIGIIGSLSNSQLFSSSFWDNAPVSEYDIFLYEFLPSGYKTNRKLEKFNHKVFEGFYYTNKFDRVFKDTFDSKKLANAINQDDLVFLFVSIETLGRFTYGKLFDLLNDTIKIMVMNAGSFPYFHPKISIQSQGQLCPLWRIEKNKLVYWNNKFIDHYKFVDNAFTYDRRDLTIDYKVNLEHNNCIFIHGNLNKLVDKEFLNIIAKLLKNDSARRFKFMGFKNSDLLNQILAFFDATGLTSQVEYLGDYSQKKNENGKLIDPNWKLCKDLLKSSAVFLNSFPKSAGSSRIEAFASGLPVIDLNVDYKNLKSTKKNRDYVYRSIDKENGNTSSKQKYYELAESVFSDKILREKIITEQYKIADEYLDEGVFWDKIIKNI